MAKILMLGHHPDLHTGLARVTGQLAGVWHRAGHEVVVIGIGSIARSETHPYKVVPANEQTDHGQDFIAEAIQVEQPDILFTIGDPWMTEKLVEIREMCRVIWIANFQVDAQPFPGAWKDWLHAVDCPVVPSEYACEVVSQETEITPLRIPYGVDTITFRPQNKEEAKNQVGVGNRFMVGTVARNQLRKNIPALIEAFYRFSLNKNDVGLFLHTNMGQPGEAWDIDELLERHGIRDITWSTGLNAAPVSDRMMCKIYNHMDVFVLPSMSEGFGLPLLEAQACGVPTYATAYSACKDLLVSPAYGLKVQNYFTSNRGLNQALIDIEYLTQQLEKCYALWHEEPGGLRAMGMAAREHATAYDWGKLLPRYVDLIDQAYLTREEKSRITHPRFHRI